jgi:flagellin-specific chaperone FliS
MHDERVERHIHGVQETLEQTDSDYRRMLTELYDCISDRLRNINADNFNNIWENIVKESGILRDNNLDELLEISQ